MTTTQISKAQIVATLGPASAQPLILAAMIAHHLDVVRFNFSWGTLEERVKQIALVRKLAKEAGRQIPIIVDLPGPRIQKSKSHTYDKEAVSVITDQDKESIKFAVEHGIEYIAVSFVGGPQDVEEARKIVAGFSGDQKIIAKIERVVALESLDQIIAIADAVMIARGDLGNEVSLEKIPFIQEKIIRRAKIADKPVITATEMLLSMVNAPRPTRAEVTDVANAILEGSDAVMLSDETTTGKYPVEAVAVMEAIILEAEHHMGGKEIIHPL